MSLWQKPISDIAFDDIDEFCKAMVPESNRLDYKLEPPKNIEKTIAAFANTLGGILIIGVDEDPTTNLPVWPPTKGLPNQPGLVERVYQKAIAAIYPPVMTLRASTVIENKKLPGHVLIAVRVDESKDAPHAVDSGRKVYIYNRAGNTIEPLELAKIDRIEHLLARRHSIERYREEIRAASIQRSRQSTSNTLMYVSIIPQYPWRPLCKHSACHAFLTTKHGYEEVQRIPTGAIFFSSRLIQNPGGNEASRETVLCEATGHYAHWKPIPRPTNLTPPRNVPVLALSEIRRNFDSMLGSACDFYKYVVVDTPGLMSVQIALKNVQNICVRGNFPDDPKPFPDRDYEDQIVTNYEELIRGSSGFSPFEDRLVYSFDIHTPPTL